MNFSLWSVCSVFLLASSAYSQTVSEFACQGLVTREKSEKASEIKIPFCTRVLSSDEGSTTYEIDVNQSPIRAGFAIWGTPYHADKLCHALNHPLGARFKSQKVVTVREAYAFSDADAGKRLYYPLKVRVFQKLTCLTAADSAAENVLLEGEYQAAQQK